MLPHGGYLGEYLVHVGQVEVAAEGQILHPPVVAAQERMHVGEAGLARGAVSQVPHVDLARKGEALLGILRVVKLLRCQVAEVGMHGVEYLGDGSRAQGPFAEHVFLAGIGLQLDASQARAFLPPVVLLLHEEVELVQAAIHPGAVLLFVVLQGFQEAYHGDAAFVFQLFHKKVII